MDFTRKHGIARLRVGVIDVDLVPAMLTWFYAGLGYDLKLLIEGQPMALDEDRASGPGDGTYDSDGRQDALMDQDKRGDPPPSSGGTGQSELGTAAPVSVSMPMTELHFGSFGAASAPARLWADRMDSTDPAERGGHGGRVIFGG
ncbi:uncharacterized protein [Triticum aestivum]|uniref:uncharacterized protein n=1 Tax=Triticum aestivum TaxID=4565 RepID=UPI001D02DB15|nr:uncharacterized protein LOC123058443 [Triticum aestivum]